MTHSDALVIVRLPAQIDAGTAAEVPARISAAVAGGETVVIADLTGVASCDSSAIRYLLKAHRRAAVSGGRVRFAVRPGGPLRRIADFTGSHRLLAVYPTLQQAIAGRPDRQGQLRPC
jgi:anti-anti-sigma factor